MMRTTIGCLKTLMLSEEGGVAGIDIDGRGIVELPVSRDQGADIAGYVGMDIEICIYAVDRQRAAKEAA